MNSLLLLLVSVCLFVPSWCEVVSLTDGAFDKQIGKSRWLVKFFAPWCGHCKRMAPEWVTLGDSLPASVARVGEVDCTANPITCQRFGVSSYPRVMLIAGGESFLLHYEGERTAAAFEAFARGDLTKDRYVIPSADDAMRAYELQLKESRSDGTVANLTQGDFFDVAEGSRLPVFVAFTMPWCGHCQKLKPVWADVARRLKGKAVVAEVDVETNRRLAERFMVRGYPTIFLLRGRRYYECHVDREVEKYVEFFEKGYKDADWSRMPMRRYEVEYALREWADYYGAEWGLREWADAAKRWQDSNYATSFVAGYIGACVVGIVFGMLSAIVFTKVLF